MSAKRLLPLIFVLALVVVTTALVVVCVDPGQRDRRGRVAVVVSILPQAQIVEKVGGERVDVTVMIPPGKSPATYEPSPVQIQRLSNAAIYFKVGHPLFPFERVHFKKILRGAGKLRIVDGARGVDLLPHNAHLWLSPKIVAVQVRKVRDALIQVDPAGKDLYKKNARAFLQDIAAVEHEIVHRFQHVRRRTFFVYHPAWSYFARDFGLKQRALESHFKAPGPKDLERFIQEAKRSGATTLFVQAQFDRRQAKVVARSIGGRVVALDPLARDWLNNLRHVAKEIAKSLRD